jgi:ABC-type uncharacterized transport system ATPase subunit
LWREKKGLYPRYMYARILIWVLTPLDGQHQEELEDAVKELLQRFGVRARVKSLSTGNEMTV